MALHLSTSTYADFKTIAANLPEKLVHVFYSVSGGLYFFAGFSEDKEFLVTGGSQSGETVGITTDFPGAVQLTGASGVATNPGLWSLE